MKVFIKNKILSLGGDSEVLNENQEPIFKVEGKLITLTKKKKIYNMQGELLYTIRNKYWTIFSDKVFIKNAQGEKVATLKKNRWSFKNKYQILDTPDEMSIDGKIFRRDFRVIKNEQVVANITKEFALVTDCFTLESEEKDIPFFTALIIAFDNIRDKKERD